MVVDMQYRKLIPAALAAAWLAAGCSLIPAYERPAAPVPAAFPNAGAAASAGAAAASDIAWQDYFADPRLRRLIDAALANNRDLRVAVLNIEQARAQFQIRRADQFPTVGLAANASRGPSPANGDLVNSFSVGLAATSWELDFFGRVASLKEQALAQYLATEEGHKAAQISLVASVATGWLNLLADEELLDLSRRTLATREESIRLAKLRFDNGVASELDYRQAESLTEAARVSLAQQQRQRALDENALVLLLGQALPDEVRQSLAGGSGAAGGPATRLADTAVMQPLPAGLPSDLLTRRPDIRQAEQQLIAANANIGAARAAFFPRITLTAQAGTVSNELSGLFKDGSWGFSVAPQLLLPIFDAGRNRAGLESARAGRDIAVAQYEKSIQTAFREVADALAGRATLGEQLRAQEAQAQAETVRFNLSDLRYRNGVASYLDLLDAQRSLFATQQAVVQTRLAQLQNQVALYRALGGGWTEPAAAVPATR
jgi:outer membrane protein, multidrug efflux system